MLPEFFEVTKSELGTHVPEIKVDFVNQEHKRAIYFLLIMVSSLTIQNYGKNGTDFAV